jgi:4-hydroxythreonine-4-phosphate dehydrogenase
LTTNKKIIIIAGDPSGIGPDLCVKLAYKKFPAQISVIGSSEVIYDRANLLKKKIYFDSKVRNHHGDGRLKIIDFDFPSKVIPGVPDKKNSQKQLLIIKEAVKLLLNKEYDALVTLPSNKNILSFKKNIFSGYTEYISSLCKVHYPVMMLATKKLRVALVTTHHALKDIPSLITKKKLKNTINVLNADLEKKFKIKHPKILVTGLNPHAGENGEFGDEERKVISPIINELKKNKISVNGPVPADTAFINKNIKEYDVFLAMYHDQGLAPFKALSFGKGVNITLGLPFVRTSVDHGTAYDIVGTKKIDSSSFFEAIKMAIKLS